MTKGKKQVDPEVHKREQHERDLKQLEDRLHLFSEPTYSFDIGESVTVGNLRDAVINRILHEGKILEIDYTNFDKNYGKPILTPHVKMYRPWTDVRKNNDNKNSLIENDDIRLNYSQTHLRGLLSKAYHFGIDFNPDYQREYVWNEDDKVKLINSIFNNIDIGKFSFIRLSDRKWEESDYTYGYEILDGKQRLRAILDYYENRFQYNGYYFNDLSRIDQNHFTDYSVNVAEVSELTYEQTLRYFLMLNTGGRIMSEEHLNKVRVLLTE